MVTNAPSRHAAIEPVDIDGEKFIETLKPWRRRLWIQQLLRWTANGIIMSIISACILLFVSHFIPWATAFYWSIGIALAFLICALGIALLNRPSLARTAHDIDIQLALHDRLSTAWELRDDSAAISALQRRDALKQLGKQTPADTVSFRPGHIRLITFAIAAIALVMLLLIPNPMNTLLQEQSAFQARLNKQIAVINQARTVINQQTAISAQERALIDKILREALAHLQQSNSEEQAQQSLAQAQSKLNNLRDPQASQKAQGRVTASSSLQNSSNVSLSNTGKALASGNSKALNNSLQNLSAQLQTMTPAQRAQLAQQIERAANQAQNNPQVSSALHQLAKAVADGSTGEVSDATKNLASTSVQDSSNQASTNNIDQASQSLQNAANALASTNDNSNGQNSSQSKTPGQGQNPGQTKASGQGQGISGQSGQNNPNNNSGKNEQVFVPGQVGSGTSNISVDGSTGTVQSGKPVPYSQVIARYSQMAHDSINNSDIPPDLKNLIQDYFNSLEGRK